MVENKGDVDAYTSKGINWTIVSWYLIEAFRVFLEPILCQIGLITPGFGDPTYGRAKLPRSADEQRLIYNNPKVTVKSHTIHLTEEALRKGKSWDRSEYSFVAYSTWQIDEAWEREKHKSSVVLLHGINNYGGRAAGTGLHLCEAGFRVIALDLPSFGRSSGLHSYIPSLKILIEATHSVLQDVIKHDPPQMRGNKFFLQGESMGGFTALYYAALYPPLSPPSKGGPDPTKMTEVELDSVRPNIAGIACAAPMVAISAHSRPAHVLEVVARVISFFAGRLPLAAGVKGNVSDDIRVEHEFHADPQTYKGYIRIATGLAILLGLEELQALAPKITVPVSFHHGKNDRATSYAGTQAFCERIASPVKSCRIWEGYEHIMMKNVKGQSEEDNRKRMAVLDAITDFFREQARVPL